MAANPLRPNLGNLKEIKAGQTSADGIAPETGTSASDTVTTQASYVNDDFGRKQTETDASGQTTTSTHDVNNNLKTEQTPGAGGHTLTNVWDYGHQLLSVSAEDRRKIDYTRNPLGQPTRAETWSPPPRAAGPKPPTTKATPPPTARNRSVTAGVTKLGATPGAPAANSTA